MRLTQNQKKVNIHTWYFDGDYKIELEELRSEIKKILEKTEGKQGFAEIDIEQDECEGTCWLETIIIYEVVEKTEEDLEKERAKERLRAIQEEEVERQTYLRLKAKFEGGQ